MPETLTGIGLLTDSYNAWAKLVMQASLVVNRDRKVP